MKVKKKKNNKDVYFYILIIGDPTALEKALGGGNFKEMI